MAFTDHRDHDHHGNHRDHGHRDKHREQHREPHSNSDHHFGTRISRLGKSPGGQTGDIHTVVEATDLTVTSASVSPTSDTTPLTPSQGYQKTVTCETSANATETSDRGMSNDTVMTRTAVRVSTLHPMSNDSWLTHHPHGRQSRATYTISRERSRRSQYRVSSSRDWSER